jgi:predicted nucleotidyltransferase
MQTIPTTLLDEVVERLVDEFSPDRIILFGSHAWGRPHEDSDLDLLVLVSESDERPHRRASRAHRCLRGIAAPMDLVVKTRGELERFASDPTSLEAEILERGIVIYGRDEAGTGAKLAPEVGT